MHWTDLSKPDSTRWQEEKELYTCRLDKSHERVEKISGSFGHKVNPRFTGQWASINLVFDLPCIVLFPEHLCVNYYKLRFDLPCISIYSASIQYPFPQDVRYIEGLLYLIRNMAEILTVNLEMFLLNPNIRFQMYPNWSARSNYASTGKKKRKRDKTADQGLQFLLKNNPSHINLINLAQNDKFSAWSIS